MESLFIGQHLIRLETVGSTNDHLAELTAEKNYPEGMLVTANHQDNGRGQRGNNWVSNPGQNLTFSCLLHPHFLTADQHFLLSMTISLGIADFLSTAITSPVYIKWPNDLLTDQGKICGILIETTLRGSAVSEAIVGIGLNVNQVQFPVGLRATSMKLESGVQQDLNGVLAALCKKIEKRYLQLRAGQDKKIMEHYYQRLYNFEVWATYKLEGIEKEARITGVDNSGRLRLQFKNGREQLYNTKEVSFCF